MAFQPLANLMDLYDGYMQPFNHNGHKLLLLQEDGRHYIIENRCPHMDAPLSTGTLTGGAIVCRAHGIRFRLVDGKAEGPLAGALDCLKQFPVSYDGNKIGIDV